MIRVAYSRNWESDSVVLLVPTIEEARGVVKGLMIGAGVDPQAERWRWLSPTILTRTFGTVLEYTFPGTDTGHFITVYPEGY